MQLVYVSYLQLFTPPFEFAWFFVRLTPSEPVSAVGAGEVKVAMKAGSVLVEDVIAVSF